MVYKSLNAYPIIAFFFSKRTERMLYSLLVTGQQSQIRKEFCYYYRTRNIWITIELSRYFYFIVSHDVMHTNKNGINSAKRTNNVIEEKLQMRYILFFILEKYTLSPIGNFIWLLGHAKTVACRRSYNTYGGISCELCRSNAEQFREQG